jgi:hypothetical protein
MTTVSIILDVLIGVNEWGLDESNMPLAGILGLLLFQGSEDLLTYPESLNKLPMCWTYKRTGSAFNAIEQANLFSVLVVSTFDSHRKQGRRKSAGTGSHTSSTPDAGFLFVVLGFLLIHKKHA